jgi:hypothetical protein
MDFRAGSQDPAYGRPGLKTRPTVGRISRPGLRSILRTPTRVGRVFRPGDRYAARRNRNVINAATSMRKQIVITDAAMKAAYASRPIRS